MKLLLFLIFLLAYFAIYVNCSKRVKRIVGGFPANTPPPPADGVTSDPSVVNVYIDDESSAVVTGKRESTGYYSFKGIRYAKSPVGNLRFQRPVALPLEGDIQAKTFGSPCVQPSQNGGNLTGSEDCLFLNIYTPITGQRGVKGLPVLFWIHGGSFRYGSANQYNAQYLVTKKLVVVTIQYRLGSLGFIGTEEKQLPGNIGLFDITSALIWVTKYISFFGGNPDKIYTAGQDSGASAAVLLAQSSFTIDWVKGVFAMSGSSISSKAVDYNPKNTSTSIFESNNCQQGSTLQKAKCLQKRPLSQLISSDESLQAGKLKDSGFVGAVADVLNPAPLVEGGNDGRFLSYFLNDQPLKALKTKEFHDIPLLTGTTKHETGATVLGSFKDDVIKKLTTIPDFISKALPQNLLFSNKGFFKNGTVNAVLSALFSNNEYLKLISTTISSGSDDLQKVMETTTDALFNLPAFTTSSIWNQRGGRSYLYSFEYASKRVGNKGHLFLGGSTLSTDKYPSNTTVVAHGDELIYLFVPQTLEGRPIPNAGLNDSKDIEIREIFTNMVSEFLHSGRPAIKGLDDQWPEFNSNTSSYVTIGEKSKISSGFRICQMALWGGIASALQSTLCNFPGIGKILESIPDIFNEGILGGVTKSLGLGSAEDKLLGGVTGALGGVGDKLGGITGGGMKSGGLLGLAGGSGPSGSTGGSSGGLLGLGGDSKSKSTSKTSETTKKSTSTTQRGVLGGLLG